MSFHLDVNDWAVNAIPAENLLLWSKPEYPGYPNVDLADPNLRFTVPAGSVPSAATSLPGGITAPLPATQPTVVFPSSAQNPASALPPR
jgi:hypothetical protein